VWFEHESWHHNAEPLSHTLYHIWKNCNDVRFLRHGIRKRHFYQIGPFLSRNEPAYRSNFEEFVWILERSFISTIRGPPSNSFFKPSLWKRFPASDPLPHRYQCVSSLHSFFVLIYHRSKHSLVTFPSKGYQDLLYSIKSSTATAMLIRDGVHKLCLS